MSFQEPLFWTDAEDATHRPYSVSEITSQVKGLLEENLPKCWVEGEISQYNHHSSGHRYFTLKDNASQLSAVMFKWQAGSLSFIPEQGMQVQVYGSISVYERGGKYQLYAEQIKPAGIGELAIAFEQLKNRLEAEGLFAEDRKRPLPPYPRKIGVVTSPTGAAIRDIIQVLDRRAPDIEIVLCPARVPRRRGCRGDRRSHRQLKSAKRHRRVDRRPWRRRARRPLALQRRIRRPRHLSVAPARHLCRRPRD